VIPPPENPFSASGAAEELRGGWEWGKLYYIIVLHQNGSLGKEGPNIEWKKEKTL